MPDINKRIIPVVLVLAALVTYGAYTLYQTTRQDPEQVVSGTIEAEEIHLGVAMGGIVQEVLVKEGDAVREDDLLALVDSVSGGSADRIRSPIDGIVLLRAAEPGEVTAAGGALLVVANLDEMTLTIYLPEDQYGQLTLGQELPISVDSFPDRVYTGRVVHISDRPEYTPQNVRTVEGRKSTVYGVRLAVANPDHDLKPGMPADVTLNLQ